MPSCLSCRRLPCLIPHVRTERWIIFFISLIWDYVFLVKKELMNMIIWKKWKKYCTFTSHCLDLKDQRGKLQQKTSGKRRQKTINTYLRNFNRVLFMAWLRLLRATCCVGTVCLYKSLFHPLPYWLMNTIYFTPLYRKLSGPHFWRHIWLSVTHTSPELSFSIKGA